MNLEDLITDEGCGCSEDCNCDEETCDCEKETCDCGCDHEVKEEENA